jgi:hypothetical protein
VPTEQPTVEPPTAEPPSDPNSDQATSEEALAALTQLASEQNWDPPTGSTNQVGGFLYVLKAFFVTPSSLSQSCINTDCTKETAEYSISIGGNRNQIPTSDINYSFNRRVDTSCSVSAIQNVAYRGTLVQISYSVRSFIGEVREDGVVVPREDSCAGYGTDHVESELERIKRQIIDFLTL